MNHALETLKPARTDLLHKLLGDEFHDYRKLLAESRGQSLNRMLADVERSPEKDDHCLNPAARNTSAHR